MLSKRIWNFIVQLLLTPISFIINLLAAMPLIALLTGSVEKVLNENISSIILFPTLIAIFGLGFVFNRLLFKIKGKKTDEMYLGEESIDILTDITYTESTNTITKYYTTLTYPAYKSRHTAMGWLATFLAFVAFPMRLVSLIMAFLAMFIPFIYVTHKNLSPDMPLRKGAVFTHTLFDFVILPVKKTETKKSPVCIVFIVANIATFVILNILAISFLQFDLHYTLMLVASLFLMLCDIVMLVKYCIVIVHDYNLKKAIINLIKLAIPPLVILIASLILA